MAGGDEGERTGGVDEGSCDGLDGSAADEEDEGAEKPFVRRKPAELPYPTRSHILFAALKKKKRRRNEHRPTD